MNRKPQYKPGDWLVKCDQCGTTRYASECALTWQNLFVCADRCWEPRHPQDFVRGKLDRTRVPISRPDTQTMQNSTTLSSAASKHAITVDLTSVTYAKQYRSIGITLDSGTVQWTYISSVSGSTITLNNTLDGAAASGNTVYLAYGDNYVTSMTANTATEL